MAELRADLATYYKQVVYDDVIKQYKGRANMMRADLQKKYNVPFPDSKMPLEVQLEAYYDKVVFDKLIKMYDGTPGKTVDDLWDQLADRYKISFTPAMRAVEQVTQKSSSPPKAAPTGDKSSPPRNDPAAMKPRKVPTNSSSKLFEDVSCWSSKGGWKTKMVSLQNGELILRDYAQEKSGFLCWGAASTVIVSRQCRRITCKSRCISNSEIDVPAVEPQEQTIVGILVDAQHSKSNNRSDHIVMKFPNATMAGEFKNLLQYTISEHSFPDSEAIDATAVTEIEHQSMASTNNEEVFAFATNPWNKNVTELAAAIFRQLSNTSIRDVKRFVEDWYKFMAVFLISAPLRAFVLVCDWQHITPKHLQDFVDTDLASQKYRGYQPRQQPVLNVMAWLESRLQERFSPSQRDDGACAWRRLMFDLFLHNARSRDGSAVPFPAAYRQGLSAATRSCSWMCGDGHRGDDHNRDARDDDGAGGGKHMGMAEDEVRWYDATESSSSSPSSVGEAPKVTGRVPITSMAQVVGLLHSPFACLASLLTILHGHDQEREGLRAMLRAESLAPLLEAQGHIPGLAPRVGSAVTIARGRCAGLPGTIEEVKGDMVVVAVDTEQVVGKGKRKSKRERKRARAKIRKQMDVNGDTAVVTVAVEELAPLHYALLCVALLPGVEAHVMSSLLVEPNSDVSLVTGALNVVSFESFAREAVARLPAEFAAFVGAHLIDNESRSIMDIGGSDGKNNTASPQALERTTSKRVVSYSDYVGSGSSIILPCLVLSIAEHSRRIEARHQRHAFNEIMSLIMVCSSTREFKDFARNMQGKDNSGDLKHFLSLTFAPHLQRMMSEACGDDNVDGPEEEDDVDDGEGHHRVAEKCEVAAARINACTDTRAVFSGFLRLAYAVEGREELCLRLTAAVPSYLRYHMQDASSREDVAEFLSTSSLCAPYKPILPEYAKQLRSTLHSGICDVAMTSSFFRAGVQSVLAMDVAADVSERLRGLEADTKECCSWRKAVEAFLKLASLTNNFDDFDNRVWRTLSRLAGNQTSEASGRGTPTYSSLGIQFKVVVENALIVGTSADPRKYSFEADTPARDGRDGALHGNEDEDEDDHKSSLRPDNVYRIAKLAANAMQLVESPATRAQVEEIVRRILAEDEPVTWEEGMRGARTSAYFLKYLESEDRDKTFEKFAELNGQKDDQPLFEGLLASAQRRYDRPLVDVADIFKCDEEYNKILQHKFNVEIPSVRDEAWKEVQRLCFKWMILQHSTYKKVKFVPHHTQIVALLMFIECFKQHQDKSLVAEIGTGEGKSVVIALLAAFLALQGKKVHVLVNNRALLKRDYAANKHFFSSLGLESAEGYERPLVTFGGGKGRGFMGEETGTASMVGTRDNPAIRYLIMNDVAEIYRDEVRLKRNRSPYSGHVLIVDEVDELIVDEIPVMCQLWGPRDLASQLRMAYDELIKNGSDGGGVGAAEKPAEVKDKYVWEHAVEAHRMAGGMVEGRHYVYDAHADRYYKRDDKLVQKHKTPRWLDYLNYRDGRRGKWRKEKGKGKGKGPERELIEYRDVVYTQAIPHTCGSYDRVFGLTGTVGGPPERDYLRREYGCELFTVPPFLSTCLGFNDTNQRTRMHCSMEMSTELQFKKIMEIALQKRKTVPVLVICQTPAQVTQLVQTFERGHKSAFQKDELQVLLESQGDINDVTQKSDYGSRFRITVTDYFGGRGHDYEIGQDVETEGGMMLILTQIPESRREWLQWLGRTARQDKRGQWALVLNAQDEPQCNMPAHVKPSPGVALDADTADRFQVACFEKRDEEMKVRTKARTKLANKGKEMNRFCDAFYAKKGFSNASQRELFEFFRDSPHHEFGYPLPDTQRMKSFFHEW